MAKTSWQKVFVAKKFREIFFENNTIHLRGKKFSWQKNFRGKKFREIFFENNTIHLRGKNFATKFFCHEKLFCRIVLFSKKSNF